MDIIKILGIGLIGTSIAMFLGEYKKEYSLIISLATGVIMLLFILNEVKPIMNMVNTIITKANIEKDYISILFKALGICLLTQIASDICVDSGNGSIATKILIAGKIAVLAISLPLFLSLIELVGALLWL